MGHHRPIHGGATIHYSGDEFISRSTMVFRKENGDWRVVHAHFSPASAAARPGGV